MSDTPSHIPELISVYLDGETTAEERASVEHALVENPEMRRMFYELRAIRAELAKLPQYRAPADLSREVLRRAEQALLRQPLLQQNGAAKGSSADIARAESGLPRRWKTLAWLGSAATAAALLILITRSADRAPAPDNALALNTVPAAQQRDSTLAPAEGASEKEGLAKQKDIADADAAEMARSKRERASTDGRAQPATSSIAQDRRFDSRAEQEPKADSFPAGPSSASALRNAGTGPTPSGFAADQPGDGRMRESIAGQLADTTPAPGTPARGLGRGGAAGGGGRGGVAPGGALAGGAGGRVAGGAARATPFNQPAPAAPPNSDGIVPGIGNRTEGSVADGTVTIVLNVKKDSAYEEVLRGALARHGIAWAADEPRVAATLDDRLFKPQAGVETPSPAATGTTASLQMQGQTFGGAAAGNALANGASDPAARSPSQRPSSAVAQGAAELVQVDSSRQSLEATLRDLQASTDVFLSSSVTLPTGSNETKYLLDFNWNAARRDAQPADAAVGPAIAGAAMPRAASAVIESEMHEAQGIARRLVMSPPPDAKASDPFGTAPGGALLKTGAGPADATQAVPAARAADKAAAPRVRVLFVLRVVPAAP